MRPAQVTGTNIRGTLVIAEMLINQVLEVLVGTSTYPRVELLPGNQLVMRYGVFHARAELPRSTTPGPSGQITLRLASLLLAVGLKAMVRQPFLRIDGRTLTIELGSMPALGQWRDLWRHVGHVSFATAPDALHIAFDADIREGETRDGLNIAPRTIGSEEQGGRGVNRAENKMRELIERQLAAGLPAFAGTNISGTLALKQELLNELLAQWLAAAQAGGTMRQFDPGVAVKFLKSASVRVEPGTVFVDFSIAV